MTRLRKPSLNQEAHTSPAFCSCFRNNLQVNLLRSFARCSLCLCFFDLCLILMIAFGNPLKSLLLCNWWSFSDLLRSCLRWRWCYCKLFGLPECRMDSEFWTHDAGPWCLRILEWCSPFDAFGRNQACLASPTLSFCFGFPYLFLLSAPAELSSATASAGSLAKSRPPIQLVQIIQSSSFVPAQPEPA